ncbi:MAG: ParB N-terminal domain-containing protein, partial [Ktedonobacteraceae bacterium]
EFTLLVADIQQRGLLEPLWTYQGKIIDGVHRYRACQQLGIEPVYREWDGAGSLLSFVVSRNLHRRHLSSTQRALVALAIEKHLAVEAKRHMALGGGNHPPGFQKVGNPNIIPLDATRQAAQAVGTNHQYVTDAKSILKKAPELQETMRRGDLSISDAKLLAKLPEGQRAEAVRMQAEGCAKTIKGAVLQIKKAAVEAQAQQAPVKPCMTLASWEDWLPKQPLCDLLITDPPYSTHIEDIDAFAHAWLPTALSKVRSTGRAYICIGAYPQELRAYLTVQVCLPVQQILVWSYRNTLGPQPARGYKHN